MKPRRNTTKIPRNHPQERKKERKLWQERGKKSEILGGSNKFGVQARRSVGVELENFHKVFEGVSFRQFSRSGRLHQ